MEVGTHCNNADIYRNPKRIFSFSLMKSDLPCANQYLGIHPHLCQVFNIIPTFEPHSHTNYKFPVYLHALNPHKVL